MEREIKREKVKEGEQGYVKRKEEEKKGDEETRRANRGRRRETQRESRRKCLTLNRVLARGAIIRLFVS